MENCQDAPLFLERVISCTDGAGEQNVDGDGSHDDGEHGIFVGRKFSSPDAAFSAYKRLARLNGYSVRIQRTVQKGGPDKEVKRVDYVCHRAGIPRNKKVSDGGTDVRESKSRKCGCKAQMRLYLVSIDGLASWNVQYFSDIHNHELLSQNEVRLLAANRGISEHCKDRLLALNQTKVSVPEMLTVLAQEQNVPVGCLPFNSKDVHNFLRFGRHCDKAQDASNMLMRCMQLKEKDPDFMFEYEGDEDNRLKHVAWSHANSVRAYRNFGDVVVFDTTYKLNSYDMPVGIWVGVNNFGSTCIFGCCLLRDEKIPSFEWALKTFLKFMNHVAPKSILTDQDLSMKEAIRRILPNTKHAFCMWHLAKKLPSYIQPVLRSQYNAWKDRFWELSRMETVEEFEFGWECMLHEYELTDNKHLADLYQERNKWAAPYIRPYFFAGMTTTNRSESMNAFIKRFIRKQVNLTDFMDQVGVAVDFLDYNTETATTKAKVLNPTIRTESPIELHAASVLTPYAFALYQKEIAASSSYGCFAEGGSPGVWLVRHMNKNCGGRKVFHMYGQLFVHCSCQLFEFTGILCRHAVAVLVRCNVFTTPDTYLPFRWRREASVPLPAIRPDVELRRRETEDVQALASKLVSESQKSASHRSFVVGAMKKCLADATELGMSCPSTSMGMGKRESMTELMGRFLPATFGMQPGMIIGSPPLSACKGRGKTRRVRSATESLRSGRRCRVAGCGGIGHDRRNCPTVDPSDRSQGNVQRYIGRRYEELGSAGEEYSGNDTIGLQDSATDNEEEIHSGYYQASDYRYSLPDASGSTSRLSDPTSSSPGLQGSVGPSSG